MFRNLFRNLTIAALLFVTSGCLLTSSNSTKESGVPVGSSTLRQIELGRTTESWLVATLGPPTSRTPVRGPGEVELLSYNHSIARKSHGSVFLLFNGSSEKVDKNVTYFEITDGVVTKYWTDA
jgi:hypothetical protein